MFWLQYGRFWSDCTNSWWSEYLCHSPNKSFPAYNNSAADEFENIYANLKLKTLWQKNKLLIMSNCLSQYFVICCKGVRKYLQEGKGAAQPYCEQHYESNQRFWLFFFIKGYTCTAECIKCNTLFLHFIAKYLLCKQQK